MSVNHLAEISSIAILDDFAKHYRRACGFQIITEGYGFRYAVNDTLPFRAGSISKLMVCMAAESLLIDDFESKVPLKSLDLNGQRSIFNLFDSRRDFTIGEILSFAISLSDNVAANWLVDYLGAATIIDASQRLGINIVWDTFDGFPYKVQSQIDVQSAFKVLDEVIRFPRCFLAMKQSLNYSRIPLGVKSANVTFYNKTASLTGMAHDIAILESQIGTMRVIFFSDNEPDTVIAGLEMGITTANLIQEWAFDVNRTTGI